MPPAAIAFLPASSALRPPAPYPTARNLRATWPPERHEPACPHAPPSARTPRRRRPGSAKLLFSPAPPSMSHSTAPGAGAAAPAEKQDFIRQIVRQDLAGGKHSAIRTRFPPEPNCYLHIGHANAICLDFCIAAEVRALCNLRFDDTNPAKEDPEFVQAIQDDVRWLGFDWATLRHASDYFEVFYLGAEKLIRQGDAYVCDLTPEQIREYRGTLTEPGRD